MMLFKTMMAVFLANLKMYSKALIRVAKCYGILRVETAVVMLELPIKFCIFHWYDSLKQEPNPCHYPALLLLRFL